MQVSHIHPVTTATFDDPNLVSAAGLVPAVNLADNAGLHELADRHLTVPTDKDADAGSKVGSLVTGMVAGADSIDDMALLKHGGTGKVFTGRYAPSTLGSFLRTFTFGHVRQLDAVASRMLARLSTHAPVLVSEPGEYVCVDIDDTIVEVHGHRKQGCGYGYSGVRGLNAQLATTGRMHGMIGVQTLMRADSAYYGHAAVQAALTGGADVSVTVRMDPAVKKAIAAIDDDAWQTIEYTDAIYDEGTGRWISKAEVAEIDYTAFTSKKKSQHVSGRLVVRRIPELNPKDPPGTARP